MKYAFVTRDDELSKKTAIKIHQCLKKYFIHDENNPDLVISIGGDGTILNAVHRYMNKDCAFVGLHTGTLG
ncbi:MAG: NAD(+)/NADH kinase, partial [Faecalibacillus sp.]